MSLLADERVLSPSAAKATVVQSTFPLLNITVLSRERQFGNTTIPFRAEGLHYINLTTAFISGADHQMS